MPLDRSDAAKQRRLIRSLARECAVMRSRVEAILSLPQAIDALCEYDVFGSQYENMLKADSRALHRVIKRAGFTYEELLQ